MVEKVLGVSISNAVIKRLADRVADVVAARVLTRKSILYNPYVSGKHFPAQKDRDYVVVDNSAVPDPAAIPPAGLWEGYGSTSEEYLSSGRDDVRTMLRLLTESGADPTTLWRVLDLGCSAGRMLRAFPSADRRSELWGVDLKSEQIAWCQQHLSPPLRFATTTPAPHLPFEDGYFDLVYCGSVFTHISDPADAWLLEIRRIVQPGAYAYITIHDKQRLRLLFDTSLQVGPDVPPQPDPARGYESLGSVPETLPTSRSGTSRGYKCSMMWTT